MKFSEQWLREWVNPDLSSEQLMADLTMAGLEVDGYELVADDFSGVVVGKVESVSKHPDADKLSVCEVSDGSETLQVICGAPNVRAGLTVAFAKIGAVLGGDFKIKKAKLRGQESFGMLCSYKELGIGDDHDGIAELDPALPAGQNVREALHLDDLTIELDLTPNRGDCLSLRGVAREVGVLTDAPVTIPKIDSVAATVDATFPVRLEAPDGCPRYLGRVIRGVDVSKPSPAWLVEKLRRCGIRSIDAVVDITNYVLLELGQPMHAFDLGLLNDEIVVRWGKPAEKLTLLDGREIEVDDSVLLITDGRGPVALAGVMGGEHSGINDATKDVFLEVAYFAPIAIAGTPRRYALNTDAGHRYERGVDFELGFQAIERATALLIDAVGGEAGPVIETVSKEHLPGAREVMLRQSRLDELLGVALPASEIDRQLARLDLPVSERSPGDTDVVWRIQVPSHRFDIELEIDLVEEVCRIYGYNRIEEALPESGLPLRSVPRAQRGERELKQQLVDLGLQEAVTYSFVDPGLHDLLAPGTQPMTLENPMSVEQSAMRMTLLPGLVSAAIANTKRQQSRVALFELGRCFITSEGDLDQLDRIGGLLWGLREPSSWHDSDAGVDFFDIKGVVEQLCGAIGAEFSFSALTDDPVLHAGQAASLHISGERIGRLGRLHPEVEARLEVAGVYVFELDANALLTLVQPVHKGVSRFPSVRRDFAVLVDKSVLAADIELCVRVACGERLVDFNLFDVYEGEGIDSNDKSLTIGLTFQDASATLTDGDIGHLSEAALQALITGVGARQR
ncbi:MAG: phenylalanine--tRNA ligase subunit beta [Pseudomonadaceae bacterium]|nr:phenylalanine--tRNA ligase subunit beta [Pseudomonadaceae bacterium]